MGSLLLLPIYLMTSGRFFTTNIRQKGVLLFVQTMLTASVVVTFIYIRNLEFDRLETELIKYGETMNIALESEAKSVVTTLVSTGELNRNIGKIPQKNFERFAKKLLTDYPHYDLIILLDVVSREEKQEYDRLLSADNGIGITTFDRESFSLKKQTASKDLYFPIVGLLDKK